ncbi:hypothetical protein D3C84_631340 [compost metagenome]
MDARKKFLLGSAWIGGAFQRYDLSFSHIGLERISRIDHEAHVWFAILIQRRGNTEDQRIALCRTGEIGSSFESAAPGGGYLGRRNVLNITLAIVQASYFTIVNINTQHIETDSIITKH